MDMRRGVPGDRDTMATQCEVDTSDGAGCNRAGRRIDRHGHPREEMAYQLTEVSCTNGADESPACTSKRAWHVCTMHLPSTTAVLAVRMHSSRRSAAGFLRARVEGLDLSSNQLTDRGIDALVAAAVQLGVLTTLQRNLYLHGKDDISRQGATTLQRPSLAAHFQV